MKIVLPMYKIEAHEEITQEKLDELIQECKQKQLDIIARFVTFNIKGRGEIISGELVYDIETALDVDALRNFLNI